jgi:hypothetical protein
LAMLFAVTACRSKAARSADTATLKLTMVVPP